MQVLASSSARAVARDEALTRALESVSEERLRTTVRTLSVPRHFVVDSAENRRAAGWIAEELRGWGYQVSTQGEWRNVVALPGKRPDGPLLLVGAHYDSVPGTPGADDNASAVAALLACAKAVSEHAPERPVCFTAFNREEDGLLGSQDFVRTSGLVIHAAHVLEMVGYCDARPGTQRLPAELPLRVRDTGDFLALIANQRSHGLLDGALSTAKSYLPAFPVMGLKLFLGLEGRLPNLLRSDHAPFWLAGIPAVMWTDTSEFRNPHYHQASDTPETLDYAFLRQVTQLLIAAVLQDRV